ncbi:MAG TPA: MBL fold metallo-hydrolase [Desulfotomaculum sp.]|nr:MAG: Putative flavoprotein [Desulfotomaculum sp. 46_80]HAG11047.1 MBL fold metallo-hydrolase [Desulfotomaculum sp.]HBY03639.1 MBL fold metallo-hydrolase [Desulfotomaculum sp.]
MAAILIKDGICWVGVRDPELRIFDAVMTTGIGTRYNAYLIKGSEKMVLMEVCEDKFFAQYLDNVKSVTDLADIDYLIMNHTEPDHSEAVAKLIDLAPNLTVLGSPTALSFLKEITNKKFNARAVNDGDRMDLGGKTLRFISAPFLHWPDTIYTYLEEEQILFTCDSFGSHYPDERLFNDLMESDFITPYKEYFDAIIGPFKPYVLEALDKIKDLPLAMVAPGHGPVLRKDIDRYIDLYRQWSTRPPIPQSGKPKIILACLSIYGFTKKLADSIVEGVESIGDFEIRRYRLIEDKLDDPELLDRVAEDLLDASGFLIGSNTVNGDVLPQVWKLLGRLSPISHGDKVAMAFGSYGWSGEAVPGIENRLQALRMQVMPGLRVKFKPGEGNLDDAFKLGMDFGCAILDKKQDISMHRWRCLVCGHIHVGAEPPAVCPACGVGADNFVRETVEDEFINDTQDKFVIIGGGIAALSAAQAIRKRNRSAEIVMLSEEEYRPYYRPALSDLLGEDLSDKQLYVFDPAWYADNRVELKTGTRVAKIEPDKRTIVTEQGESIPYTKLIVATGARSNMPPFKGLENRGVHALRSLQDSLLLKEAIKSAKKAVVIGGGVLGLEAVWEMVSSGVEVAVIEHNQRIMPRQLDEPASGRLQALMESKGVKLYLGLDTAEIVGDGQARGVRLSDGRLLEADLALISTGVKPNMELARDAGIDVAQGIVVDGSMRTSQSSIYAAGAGAQFGERLVELWPVSLEMGRVAGAAAAGDWVEYKAPLLSTMLVAFDMEIFSIGEVNLPPELCRIVEVNDPAENFFKRSYIKDGVLVGEIIIAPKVDATQSMQNLGRTSGGQKRIRHWKCRVCGYVHEGPEPPDECPVCGSPKYVFYPID